jgi:hypothetical protein
MWIEQLGFMDLVNRTWNAHVKPSSIAKVITVKFKNVRYELMKWGRNLSQLKLLIEKCNKVIFILDEIEETRQLSRAEFNFRNIVKVHLKGLLSTQSVYWKNRCTICRVKFGGENTKYFHAKAIERYRHNAISEIKNGDGVILVDHHDKADAF